MKKHRDIIITVLLLLFFSVTVYSQSAEEQFEVLEKAIEKTIRTRKQESLTLLEQMYAICKANPDNSLLFARTILIEADINDNQGIQNTSLLGTIQKQLEKNTISLKEEVLFKLALVSTYYTLGDFIQAFNISIELLEQAKQLNDSILVAKTLNYLGNVCYVTELNSMGEEYYSQALTWVPYGNNMQYTIIINLYSLCLRKEEKSEQTVYLDSLLFIIKELEELNTPELNELLPRLYLNVSNYLENRDDRYNYLIKALELYKNNPHRYASINNNIGFYYLNEKHDLDKALEYLTIARKIFEENNSHFLGVVYENISRVYREMGAPDSALLYLDKVEEIKKMHENHQQIMEANRKNITTTLDVAQRKLDLAKTENELKDKQLITSIVVIIAVLITGTLLVLFFIQKRKRMKQEAEELSLRLEKEQALQQAQTELLENKLREITSYSLLLSNNDQLLNQIKEVNDLRANKGVDELEIKKQIDKLVKNNLSTGKHWDDFVVHFTKVNPNFFKSLQEKFPEVTANDLKLCAYLRMGMSSKQIAQILNISHHSVEVNKYRLKKKLNLSTEDSLRHFIGTI